jgi:hypothetical protein
MPMLKADKSVILMQGGLFYLQGVVEESVFPRLQLSYLKHCLRSAI